MTIQRPQKNDFLFTILLTAILCLLLCCTFIGCGKKTLQTNNQTNSIVQKTRDSIKILEISQGITDTVFISVPVIRTIKPDCDSVANDAINKYLSTLHYRKQSGENNSGLYYDKYKKLLAIYQKVGASKNENTKVGKTEYVTVTKTKTTEIPIKYIPKWIQYLAWFGGLSAVYVVYRVSRIWT